jgi:hypothetical protein
MKRAIVAMILVCACKRHHDDDAITFPDPPPPPPMSSVAANAQATPSASAMPSAAGTLTPEEMDAAVAILRALGSIDAGDIGLGNIGTLGHGATGTGDFGTGGHLGGGATSTIRQGTTMVNGRLPPEVIQRIVRQNFGRFRVCYENGLKRDPKLAGKVTTKLVIDRAGNVSNVMTDSTTTLPDAAVVACVGRVFSRLVFPQPEGGIVTVVYPLIFNPPDP